MGNGTIIKYPDYVKRIQITGKDNYRNLLRIKFEDENGERENEFMAVCMNPSKANLEHSDDTVNKLKICIQTKICVIQTKICVNCNSQHILNI